MNKLYIYINLREDYGYGRNSQHLLSRRTLQPRQSRDCIRCVSHI